MSKIITNYATRKFGCEQRKRKTVISKENRKELKMKQFRSELKYLRKQYKIGKPEKKTILMEAQRPNSFKNEIFA